MLTLDNHEEFVLEFLFKEKIVCLDVNITKIKYKNGDGNVMRMQVLEK